MNCENPQRIYNESLKQYMFVPCRYCKACRVAKANKKTVELYQTLKQYPFAFFVTLTYNNDSLPIVLAGDNRIIRGCNTPFGEILGYLDKPAYIAGLPVPKNSKIYDCVGVLYYPDLTNFFKRLRTYYERKYKQYFEYKYFSLGEYGTREDERKRPHFHIIFYGRENQYKRLLSAVLFCWQYASWHKLEAKEYFKPCDASTAAYLASYVNIDSRTDGLLATKQFEPKTGRSKNSSYGLEISLQKDFEKLVKRGWLDNEVLRGIQQPFTYIDCSKKGDFATRILPTRFFSAYFHKPRFCSTSSFDYFCRCAGETWARYKYNRKSVKSSDYLFCLGYRRYITFTGYIDNIHVFRNYLDIFWHFYNYYKSVLLKHQMLAYETKKKGDYLIDLVDSYIDSPTKRYFQLRRYLNDAQINDVIFHPVSATQRNKTNAYIEQYKNKLCKKHTKRNEINF